MDLWLPGAAAVQDQLRHVQQIQASASAFAAILGDGSVVTWGCATYGGDCRAVQPQLQTVQQIQASQGAFAAILVNPWVDVLGEVVPSRGYEGGHHRR